VGKTFLLDKFINGAKVSSQFKSNQLQSNQMSL